MTCLSPTSHPPVFLMTPRTPARSSTTAVATTTTKYCSCLHMSTVTTVNECVGNKLGLRYKLDLTFLLSWSPARPSSSTSTSCHVIATSVGSCLSPSSRSPYCPPEVQYWAQMTRSWAVAKGMSVVLLRSTLKHWVHCYLQATWFLTDCLPLELSYL
jgi:hypothetical protein